MAGPADPRSDLALPGRSRVDDKGRHVEYLHMLEVPTAAQMEEIAGKQEKNEELSRAAAGVIQRNYRGHRSRRAMKGIGLDASMRWIEAIKEAQYRHITQPMPKRSRSNDNSSGNVNHFTGDHDTHTRSSGESEARETWKRGGYIRTYACIRPALDSSSLNYYTVARIARRAGGDDEDSPDEEEEEMTEEQRATRRQKKQEEKLALKEHAKMMDLQYFLEMVDLKHRYGSNLRVYHQEWKKADTKENFFYWLDYGEGKQISVSICPRERLDREQVRYLSREERIGYLVKIDDEGRLCWAKNGARIDTSEKYRDSIHGIVPISDTTPAFSAHGAATIGHAQTSSTLSSSSFSSSSASSPPSNFMDKSTSNEGDHYVNEELSQAKGLQKLITENRKTEYVDICMSSLRSVKMRTIRNITKQIPNKKQVADTSFRLYVGIKQSGAFQHTSNFRSFVRMLKKSGADMSRVSISKSYAVLVGLEMYTRTRQKVKAVYQSTHKRKEEVLHPKAMAEEKEREREKSRSAEKERRFLEEQAAQHEEVMRDENASVLKVLQKLHVHPQTPPHGVPHPKVPAEEQDDDKRAGCSSTPPPLSSELA
ncbi:MAG: hypothetical protein M1840_008354 [Geoglossum simile]|nr:MAG: hypothetical protein M1840_008354 [Geoglossum simile]